MRFEGRLEMSLGMGCCGGNEGLDWAIRGARRELGGLCEAYDGHQLWLSVLSISVEKNMIILLKQ